MIDRFGWSEPYLAGGVRIGRDTPKADWMDQWFPVAEMDGAMKEAKGPANFRPPPWHQRFIA